MPEQQRFQKEFEQTKSAAISILETVKQGVTDDADIVDALATMSDALRCFETILDQVQNSIQLLKEQMAVLEEHHHGEGGREGASGKDPS